LRRSVSTSWCSRCDAVAPGFPRRLCCDRPTRLEGWSQVSTR
jgi:hypothetical protein